MAKTSAGLLPYRIVNGLLQVLLVHPGGPFWARKDDGAWSIAKGEVQDGEDPLAAARREFTEETGFEASGDALPLGAIRQKAGKEVIAFAVAADVNPACLRSNTFEMEWPKGSGRRTFPEVDRAAWFSVDEAKLKILDGQAPLLDRLAELLAR